MPKIDKVIRCENCSEIAVVTWECSHIKYILSILLKINPIFYVLHGRGWQLGKTVLCPKCKKEDYDGANKI